MKHKKSINAKDFIEVSPPRSPPLDLGSSREDVIAHGHHEFLSKIYSKANRQQRNSFRFRERNTIDVYGSDYRRRLKAVNSPFLTNSSDHRLGDFIDGDGNDSSRYKREMKGERKSQQKQKCSLNQKPAKYRERKNKQKTKTTFHSPKLTSFCTKFSKTKLFDDDIIPVRKQIFETSKTSMEVEKNANRLNPYQLAVRKKNIKLIKMKINSLGSKADEEEKNLYGELAQGIEKQSLKRLKNNRRYLLFKKQQREGIKRQQSPKRSNIWSKYTYERNKSQSSEKSEQKGNSNTLPALESTSIILSQSEKRKQKRKSSPGKINELA